jgi:hypothetical protein
MCAEGLPPGGGRRGDGLLAHRAHDLRDALRREIGRRPLVAQQAEGGADVVLVVHVGPALGAAADMRPHLGRARIVVLEADVEFGFVTIHGAYSASSFRNCSRA